MFFLSLFCTLFKHTQLGEVRGDNREMLFWDVILSWIMLQWTCTLMNMQTICTKVSHWKTFRVCLLNAAFMWDKKRWFQHCFTKIADWELSIWVDVVSERRVTKVLVRRWRWVSSRLSVIAYVCRAERCSNLDITRIVVAIEFTTWFALIRLRPLSSSCIQLRSRDRCHSNRARFIFFRSPMNKLENFLCRWPTDNRHI